MLDDKDRIFRNLYGTDDWGLEGARARGAWDGTKAILEKGRDAIINEMKASGLRGRGGAGFPTGLKWSFMPKQSDGRPHYLVVNADEVGARHLQGPRDHAARSASPGRGLPDRRLRHGRACRLHLRPRRVHPRARASAGGGRSGLCGQADRQEQRPRLGLRSLRPPRRRRLYLRRGDRAAGKPRRQEGQPRLKPPFPANMGLYGCPTTVNNVETIAWCPTSCGAAPPGSPRSAGRTIPAPSCSASPATSSKPCNVEEAMGVPLRELIETPCRRRARRLGQSARRDPGRLVGAAGCRRSQCDDLPMDFDALRRR